MKYKINKHKIQLIIESTFMLGVNKGFHDSPLPEFAVKNYSNLDTLKNHKRKDDVAIAQDLGLRMGSQALSKATIGGATFAAMHGLQDLVGLDLNDHQSMLVSAAPAVVAAWAGSDLINRKIPETHRKLVGEKNSIYKGRS